MLFALLGLSALYFLLKGLLDKPSTCLSGCRSSWSSLASSLVLTYLHELNPAIPHVSTNASLVFIVLVLVVVSVASWLKVRKDPEATAHAGRMTGGGHDDDQDA